MKICFLGLENLSVLAPEFSRHNIGGEQVQHTLLAKALARRGHEVSMVVADYGQEDGAVWNGVRTYKAYRQDAGIPALRFVHPRWTGLWSALRRADADITYTSCAGMQVGLASMFCARHARRLVYRIAHDTDCDPNNVMIRYARDKWLYRYGVQRTHAILAQSDQQREGMLRNYGKDSRIATMLVDPPDRHIPHRERDIDVLWVNNIRQFKRPDLAIALAERLPNARFHMVGGEQSGCAEYYREIHSCASALPNMVFHGRVPYHQVGPLYGRAKVFVNTSDSEGFPNSYLQAWVRGAPVIAFFDPDGVIRREGLGQAASSLDEMAQAVGRLLADDQAREMVGERCRAYMDREYGEEKILAPYLEVFSELEASMGKGRTS